MALYRIFHLTDVHLATFRERLAAPGGFFIHLLQLDKQALGRIAGAHTYRVKVLNSM